MTGRVILTAQAERDLLGIQDVIGLRSERTVERFRTATEETLARVAGMPGLGEAAPVESLAASGVRCTGIDRFPNYVAFYRPIADGVRVLRVIHAARDLESTVVDVEIE